MQIQILVGADFDLAPFAVAIVATYVVVGLHVTERQTCPIQIFHCLNLVKVSNCLQKYT